ncbi:MAG: alpha/beta fold hydrolase [Myxococcales bacterium]|nr:alpha/beta fold hydrolase [Myxococcales bacterium]
MVHVALPSPGRALCLAVVATALGALGALGCRPEERPAGLPSSFAPCRIGGGSREGLCGEVVVPERRTGPDAGRTLALGVAVLPARQRGPADPIYFLAGGPGQAATSAFLPLLPALRDLSRDRDLVFVDQRGTGGSGRLACDEAVDDGLGDDDALHAAVSRCARAWQSEVDLEAYTSIDAAEDLEAVRAALGHERVNLLGVSYGTRLALVYLARHPERVRTATLDGAMPTAMVLPLAAPVDAEAALDRLFADCRAEPRCDGAFPDLAARFAGLLAGLDAAPAKVTLADPRTGRPRATVVGRTLFAKALRSLLYSVELSALVPLVVDRALASDFAPLVSAATLVGDAAGAGLAVGLFFAVVCQEDLPRVDAAGVERASGTFLGRSVLDDLERACAAFPRAPLPEDFAAPTRADAAVLALSGELDPVTPPRWADEALRALPNGRSVVVRGAAHNVIATGCAPRLVRDFVAAGSAAELDPACLEERHRPPFFVDFAGPPP